MTFAAYSRLGWPPRWSAGALSLPGYPPGPVAAAGRCCRSAGPCDEGAAGPATATAVGRFPAGPGRRIGGGDRGRGSDIRSGRAGLSMAERELPASASTWLTLQIPLGRMWARRRHSVRRWPPSPVTFTASPVVGCCRPSRSVSPISPMRAPPVSPYCPPCWPPAARAGYSVGWPTISGSLAAPMLAHLAINESAAAAALIIQRRSGARRP